MAVSPRIQRAEEYARILAAASADKCVVPAMAALGRSDLFFLLTRILKRTDADRDWLFDRCNDIQRDPDGRLDLWAREHYKSTIITFAKTIQDILIDPEVTVGIFSHTRPIAKGFLRQIKREFEENELLKELYPEILYTDPRKESPKWSEDDGIIVKRQSNPKEATVEAWGLVDGQPTSKHFSLMVYDDVVTRESVTTPDMIIKTTDAWALSRNLSSENGCRTRYIGTRYHAADSWGEILRRGAAVMRMHPATNTGKPEGSPVLLTPERIAVKRAEMGPYIFACQMLQDPKADTAMGFMRAWLKFWRPVHWSEMNRYILVDPAGEKKRDNDYTVMAVIGLARDRNYYLIDMIRDRLNLTERGQKLFYLHQKYRPLDVGYEKYGMQSDIEHFRYLMELQTYNFNITPVGGPMPKADRIRRLVPIFEQGRLFLPEYLAYTDYEGVNRNLTGVFIEEEYLNFPVAVHDDMLDCVARIMDPDFTTLWPAVETPQVFFTQSQADWSTVMGDADLFGAAINVD